MTDLTARLKLPLLQPGQAQKEMFHNEALTLIDAALHPATAAPATNDPPATPADGQMWIIGATPSGAWSGRAGTLATWTSGGWRFVAPLPGMTVWLSGSARWAWHDGTVWRMDALPCAGIAVDGVPVLGARKPAIAGPSGGTTVDAEARTGINQILAAMRAHGLIDT